jgi:hypothetical protein
MRQRDLFDDLPPPEPDGEALREEALARVREHADPGWYERALAALHALAGRQGTVTADDLWALVEPPREPRALGAVLREGRRNGWVVPTEKTVKSARAANHARPIRVWRSLVCGPE